LAQVLQRRIAMPSIHFGLSPGRMAARLFARMAAHLFGRMAAHRIAVRLPAAVCAAAVLAACTPGLVNPAVPPPGTESFQEGYIQGCASGYQDARREGYVAAYHKDAARYASEADYRLGWDEGHDRCYQDEMRHPRMCGPGPETLSCP
jgi:hypothetical protein